MNDQTKALNNESYPVTSFIDTAEYQFYWLETWRRQRLFEFQAALDRKCIIRPPRSPDARYSWWVQLQQPCREALMLMAEIPETQYRTSRVDVACDFPPEAQWLVKHIRQKWRGKRRCYRIGGHTYWSGQRDARNVLPYSDKESKATGEPCFHLELRFVGQRTLERAMLYQVEDQLTGPNVLELLQHQLRLDVLDRTKLLRLIAKHGSVNQFLKHESRFVGSIQFRVVSEDGPPSFDTDLLTEVPVQLVYDYFPRYRKCFKEVHRWENLIGNITWYGR